jgi:hypothetical protein
LRLLKGYGIHLFPPNYSALKNSIFRVINSSSKTEVCFLTIAPAD